MSLPESHSSGVGTIGRREAHHTEHEDEAYRRRGRRADAGVDQVHVLEHQAERREDRRVLFRLHAADDGGREDGGFVLREHRAPRGEGVQRGADHPQIVECGGAVIAPFEVRVHGNLIGNGELAVVKRLEPPARRRAGERLHAVLASRSSRRSACRARVSRDFTVPTATPSEKAISS